MGRISLDTVIQVNANVTNLRFYLQEENFRLNEVHITAENSKAGQATSSKISRLAMDHMQATSLGDVMQLLPGGLATNPNLGYASQLNLRMISENASGIPGVTDGEEEAANMNSLGTLIIRDGAPVSNNANLQTVSPAITGRRCRCPGYLDRQYRVHRSDSGNTFCRIRRFDFRGCHYQFESRPGTVPLTF